MNEAWSAGPPPYRGYDPEPEPQKWYQRKWVKVTGGVLVVLVVLGAILDDGDDDVEVEEAAAEVTTTTTEVPVEISEEAAVEERETTTTAAPTTTQAPTTTIDVDEWLDENSDVVMRMALQTTWNDSSPAEQREICSAVDLLGVDVAAMAMYTGAEGEIDLDIIEEALRGWC